MASFAATPAILGGTPVEPDGPPGWPMPDAEIEQALLQSYAEGSWGQYCGPNLVRLEQLLAETLNVPHVFPCASGTLAVEIALKSLRIQPNDEVILAGYEYEPNFLSVLAVGARPVLVDTRADAACLDVDRLEAAVQPTVKAIIATHLHGGMVDMPRLRAMADRWQIQVIEDASQVSGATIGDRLAGAWGDFGIWSFGGSKLISAGRGGALFVQRDDHAQRAKLALQRGIQQWGILSELQATVLLPQLRKLPERTRHRQAMVQILQEGIGSLPGITPFRNGPEAGPSAYYKLGFYYDASVLGLPRETFVVAMRAEWIAFDVGFRALHVGRSPSRFRAAGSLTGAERAHREVIMLHHPVLSHDRPKVERIVQAIHKIHNQRQQIAERLSLPA